MRRASYAALLLSCALPVGPLPGLPGEATAALGELAALARGSEREAPVRVVVVCRSDAEASHLRELKDAPAKRDATEAGDGAAPRAPVPGMEQIEAARGSLHAGFVWTGAGGPVALVPYHELVGRFETRRGVRTRHLRAGRALDDRHGGAPLLRHELPHCAGASVRLDRRSGNPH